MIQNKKRYKAMINDHTYTIIGNENKDHMDMVVDIVNDQLKEINRLSSNLTEEQSAVLLSINAVSDQLHKQSTILSQEKQIKQLENQVKRLEIAAEKAQELEIRIKRMEEIENQAKNVLRKNGENKKSINHMEAQQIMNEQAIEKIKQQYQQKNNE